MLQRILPRLFRKQMAGIKEMRRSQFAELAVPPGHVVFLGDSITEQGIWNEWFPNVHSINRGIGGDTVRDVRDRIHVTLNQPAAVFLLIGTNDIGGLGSTTVPWEIAGQIRELITDIKGHAPAAPLIISSVMPRAAAFAKGIRELNAHIRRFAEAAGAEYIDLWPTLASGDALRMDCTNDGLHLNGTGYRAWTDALRPSIERVVG